MAATLRYNPDGSQYEVDIDGDIYGPLDLPEDGMDILSDEDTGVVYLAVTSGYEGDEQDKVFQLSAIATTVESGELQGSDDEEEAEEVPEV